MIRCILIFNLHGKARLTRYYDGTPVSKQTVILSTLHAELLKRNDDACCSIVINSELFSEEDRVVYRLFATLYFVFVIDGAENELATLELIETLVMVMDSCFNNVCELDLIFNFDRANYILDEMVMSGMPFQVESEEIIHSFKESQSLK